MSELLKVLQDGDVAGLELEQAREAVEQSKASWELAKERFDRARAEFDAVVSRADEAGLPRAKLKKLLEDRTAALWTSGLVGSGDERIKVAKSPRPPRKPKVTDDSPIMSEAAFEDVAVAAESH